MMPTPEDLAGAVLTIDLVALKENWRTLNARAGARVHFVGAWQRYGFHEDGLWSAHRLCAQLLGRDPWPTASAR